MVGIVGRLHLSLELKNFAKTRMVELCPTDVLKRCRQRVFGPTRRHLWPPYVSTSPTDLLRRPCRCPSLRSPRSQSAGWCRRRWRQNDLRQSSDPNERPRYKQYAASPSTLLRIVSLSNERSDRPSSVAGYCGGWKGNTADDGLVVDQGRGCKLDKDRQRQYYVLYRLLTHRRSFCRF